MKLVKVSSLEKQALNWAVAKAQEHKLEYNPKWKHPNGLGGRFEGNGWYIKTKEAFPYTLIPSYSTDWSQGGPIIEREEIETRPDSTGNWFGSIYNKYMLMEGPTPLVAAMRCYVASKLGDKVEIPDEFLSI